MVLNGHIDVVPEGPLEMWDAPPYEPHVDGDWLYGRGAGDMKAGLVGAVFALVGHVDRVRKHEGAVSGIRVGQRELRPDLDPNSFGGFLVAHADTG